MRFPHYGSSRHEAAPTAPVSARRDNTGPRLPRDIDPAIPDRACCCPAKPMVKVVMPASRTRPAPIDLWLCGHHWRVSAGALAEAGAAVYDVSTTPFLTEDERASAPV